VSAVFASKVGTDKTVVQLTTLLLVCTGLMVATFIYVAIQIVTTGNTRLCRRTARAVAADRQIGSGSITGKKEGYAQLKQYMTASTRL